MKLKCLVTGGAGFIGSNLVDKLILDGHDVTVIDNESSDAHDQFYWNEKANNYKYNICDYEMCSDVFERHQPDVVFHIAAEARIQPCIIDPLKAVEANVVGTVTILELSRKHKVKRVVYSSTSSAYGLKNTPPLNEDMPNDCLNPYSITKTSGEELCKMYSKLYNLETIIFRYFNVYGERQPLKGQYAPVIGLFIKQNKEGKPLTVVGDGTQRRDFTHINDVVSANILAGFNEVGVESFGQVYNVGYGKSYSILDIASMVSDRIEFIPARPGEAKETLSDTSKIKKEFGWSPTKSLDQWIMENR